jgi:hypothetical protein
MRRTPIAAAALLYICHFGELAAAGFPAPNNSSVPSFHKETEEDVQARKATATFAKSSMGACKSEELKPFFAKTPCDGLTISSDQLSDTTIPSEEERAAAKVAFARFRNDFDIWIQAMRRCGGSFLNESISIDEKSVAETEVNILKLIAGQIDWGAFNARRLDIATKRRIAHEAVRKTADSRNDPNIFFCVTR